MRASSRIPPESLRCYLPQLLAERIAAGAPDAAAPWTERFPAVVMLADISGFTALAERLAPRGARGAEELSRILNDSFGRMIDLIESCGGDVLRFAGDAPIVVWRARSGSAAGGEERELARLVKVASSCGLALQREFHDRHIDSETTLAMRVGIAAGRVLAACVGGVERRFEVLVTGAPLSQMGEAERAAGLGEVVLAASAASLVEGEIPLQPVGDGMARVLSFDLAPESGWPGLSTRPAPPVEASTRFIPRSVTGRLDAGQEAWLAELRHVTVLFAGLGGLDDTARDAGERLNEAFRVVQKSVYRLGGGVNQFLVDDKGTNVLAAWGIPGKSHEDNARRAVLAAMEMSAGLARIGVACRAGITCGRVFCGERGSDRRREYALVGSTVNLAARLMAHAESGVLCDEATHAAARRTVTFESLAPLTVKGRVEPVPVFRPCGVPGSRGARAAHGPIEAGCVDAPVAVIGRRRERDLLAGALSELTSGESGTVIVCGEAGIGKSTLLRDLVARGRSAGVRVATGEADSISRDDPYHVWTGLLAGLLDVPDGADQAARRGHVLTIVANEPELSPRAPLLDAVLDLGLGENDVTSQMSREVRGDATRDLVVRLVQRALDGRPLLLVLDDAHWFDSASWALALAAQRGLSPLMLVLGTRPVTTDRPAELDAIEGARNVRRVDLERLADEDVAILVGRRLGARDVPRHVLDLVRDKAGGHPLFVTELASSLLETGAVAVEDGVCRVSGGPDSLAAHRFPDTVQGVVLSRIDRLDESEQLTLKVASVIGRVFSYSTLHDVHPMKRDRSSLRDQLDHLERSEVTKLEAPEPRLSHAFRHAVIHEVAYRLMMPEQRRQLHRRVAEWNEREHADDPPYALLAHHWTLAEDDARSFDSLEAAGAQAIRKGAEREAASFFERALDLADQRGGRAVPLEREVLWLRNLGHARYVTGESGAAGEILTTALQRLGHSVPRGKQGWGLRLAREGLRQVWHLAWPYWLPVPHTARSKSQRLEASRLMNLIAGLAFYRDDALPFVTASLHAVNLAEAAGTPSAAAGGYAPLAYLVAIMRLTPLARRWWRRCARSSDARDRLNGMFGEGLYALGMCRFDEGERIAERAIELSRRTGDRFSLESALTVKLYLQHYTGHFRDSLRTAAEILESAKSRASSQREVWGHLALASDRLELGETERARADLASADDLLDVADNLSVATYHGLRTTELLRSDDLEGAEREAGRAMERVRDSSPLSFVNFAVFVPILETRIALWSRALARGGSGVAQHRKAALRAFRLLRRFARTFPFARPRTLILHGQILHLDGSPQRAGKKWRAALELAHEVAMPVEQALAHERLGSAAVEEGADGGEHLRRALELYERMDCASHWRRVEELSRSAAARPGATRMVRKRTGDG